MKLRRLSLTVIGTRHSHALSEGEIITPIIPLWLPIPRKNLVSEWDIVQYYMHELPPHSGDSYETFDIESAQVSDDFDANDPDGSDIVFYDDSIIWNKDHNVMRDFISNALHDLPSYEPLIPSNIDRIALAIYQQHPFVFGWNFLDSYEVIDTITAYVGSLISE